MSEDISADSTKEEIANYFLNVFKINEDTKNNLIKEDISGDILLEITEENYKSFGIKKGPILKIKKFLKDNADKFKIKEIKEKITAKSNSVKVENFFKKCLDYKGELNGLDGKGLIELDQNEEGIKKLGLNLGQKLKLKRYIAYFKTLKEEEESENDFDFIIDENSTDEDLLKFLRIKCKLSEKAIEELGIDLDNLLLFDDEAIDDDTCMNETEKETFKSALKELKKKLPITLKSSKEQVAELLKIKLEVSDEFIKKISDYDGERLLGLEPTDIEKFKEISKEQKEKLINIIKESKQKLGKKEEINDKKKKESFIKIIDYLIKKLNFTEKSIEKLKSYGEKFFELKYDDIDKIPEISEEEKQKLKYFIDLLETNPELDLDKMEKFDSKLKEMSKKIQEKKMIISYESTKEEVSKLLKTRLNFDDKLIKTLNFDGEILFLLDENDIEEIDEISKEKKAELINILNQVMYKINIESDKEEVAKFLSLYLNFQENSINKIALDGEKLFSLTEETLDKMEITQKEKENLKKFIKRMNINISKSSNKYEVFKFLKIKLLFSYKSIRQLDMDGEKLLMLDEEEILILKGITEEERQNLLKFTQKVKKSKMGIQKLNQNSKYNIFFILGIKENFKQYLSISTFSETSYLFSSEKTKIENAIIESSDYSSEKNEKINLYMYQAISEKKISKLLLSVTDKYYNLKFECSIDNKKNNEIYFNIKNLYFGELAEEFYEIPIRIIFDCYLTYFFNKNKNIIKNIQLYSLKSLLNHIKNVRHIELYPETILKLFKFCIYMSLEPESIDALEIIGNKEAGEIKKNQINKEYYLSDADIEKLRLKMKKLKFINLIIEIYSNYDSDYLLLLMQSKNANIYSEIFLNLLFDNKIKFDKLFKNAKDLKFIQKKLLLVAKKKYDVNYIIKLSKGLYNNLTFIEENFKTIYEILEKNASFFSWSTTNYQLSLDNLEYGANIDEIIKLISSILSKNKGKNYKILDYNEIFESLVNVYSNDELNQFCKLHNLIGLFKQGELEIKIVNNFYNKVHEKGLFLIKQQKLKSEEIINFIVAQDIYYKNPNYNSSRYRDPIIFKYIIITDKNEDYKKNIELIKKYKLWEIFSNTKQKEKFHKILLEQMIKISDFQSLFDIFNIKYFDREFISLINNKFKDIILTVLDENKKNYEKIYKIFDKWIIINANIGADLTNVIQILYLNYDITSKYFFYLLKSKEMRDYTNDLKDYILKFFLFQNRIGSITAESLISLLLLLANNDLYLISFLNQLDKKILKENEFYQKEESDNFLLFKLFFQKCNDLIKNPKILEGNYLKETIKVKSKIYNDLQNNNVPYNIVYKLMEEEENFYNKILVITQNENEAKKFFQKFKDNIVICTQKLNELSVINDFYTSFYSSTQEDIIKLIKKKLAELKKKYVCEIPKIDIESIFRKKDDLIIFRKAKEECKRIKYKNSIFFMAVYSKNKDNLGIDSEDKIFQDTINDFKESMKEIILQKETKKPFFEIKNIEQIMNAVNYQQNDLRKEINFLEKEFSELGKDDYIKNNLLEDLINFSKKDIIKKILQGIIELIEAFKDISEIQLTEFMDNLKRINEILKSSGVSGEEIKKAKDLLLNYKYDINKETALIDFYGLFYEQKKSIQFLKTIKEKNFDIRYLNEFIDESDSCDLQTSDIDNLIYVNDFFTKLIQNKNINTDKKFLDIFKEEYEKDKDIAIKLNGYLKSYGEIILLYQLYSENPEMTIEKISSLLKDSKIVLYKDEKLNSFNFFIQYKKQGNQNLEVKSNIKELNELRNKILMSSSNENVINKVGQNLDQKILERTKITKEFVNLIDNIKQLNNTLNSLLKSGYSHSKNLTLKVENAKAFEDKDKNKDLQRIIDDYKEINKTFKNDIREGYKNFPILRLFHGQNFLQLYEKIKNKKNDITILINSVTLGKIKNPEVDYNYDNKKKELENINIYLEKLFNKYKIELNQIYNKNQVNPELNLKPGLYRKIKVGDNNLLIDNILNIYQNMTKNVPIINTLLICNEDTSIEKIRAFLYRAMLCNLPVLFIITNIECLELSVTQNIIKILKILYKYKNKHIDSYLLFIYEKIDSGLVRDLEKLIPERNILSDNFLKKPEKMNEMFEKIELYSSKYSGYGKTTEIKYKVKNLKGNYKYLPIGGSFTRDYIINNLINLKLDLQEGNKTYLHLDLSETDNDDLMTEILFKLIIMRYLDSNETIYYLGYDVHIIIEIPKGFIEFDKKYKLLNLFKKIYIDKLYPLRLEEGAKIIKDSPISIVAEVLEMYDNNQIGTKNIDLKAKIKKNSKQCEEIINRHFNVENQGYYQKMNFIKILSVQFIKFTNNIYLNYDFAEEPEKKNIIKKARISVISNFIKLTNVFTRSPFDGVLLSQNKSMEIFGKYDENQAIDEGIDKLSDEKQKKEIFSFEKIKPSLVFFNRDGGSLSIISNNNKDEQEYKDLKELWNSQNVNMDKKYDLIDYKKLQHDEFLEQIKILFSLDKMSIEELKKKCEDLDNYIFVADNFIKMVRILLNIEAKIPVILMGETGVGKTKLLEMLALLYGKGNLTWHRLSIHAGITDKAIVEFIEKITEEERIKKEQLKKEKNIENKDDIVWIFLDEINTCNSLGLITEIMCNHTYLGKKIDERFVFLGACNPYRVMQKKMRESGLIYYNMKEKNKLNNLVYTVNPLPHSLLNFIFDFGWLQPEDEKKYIRNTVISFLSKIIKIDEEKNKDDLKKITEEIIESISICHDFIREKYDKSSVSMRELRRFAILFKYFFENLPSKIYYTKMKSCLNMTLYLCYYLRLNDKKDRKELELKLNKFFKIKNFIKYPEFYMKMITGKMLIEKGKGIALNRALRENLFSCYTCIKNAIPIIIIGKPGTGKTLSFQILFNTLKGENSEKSYFRDKGKLYRYYYQGSETSTSEGIEKVFQKALNAKNKSKNEKNINLVFFDEMGLAERSSNNPLKVIHYLLERDKKDTVPFLGISNWRLDAAKINRALNISITDYDIEDLVDTANSIAEALDFNLSNKYKEFFEILAKVFNEYIILNQNSTKENKDFHGNRDFYHLIKSAMKELIIRKNELNKNENKILTEVGLMSLCRNFGGLEHSNTEIIKIFKQLFEHKFDESIEYSKKFSVLEAIKKNVMDSNSRYLMLISEGNDATDITKYLLKSLNKKFIELVGSKYKSDIKSGRYSEEILNKIKYIMETDNILILRDLDMIYPSLYDLFNQNFTILGDKKYARIAFEYAKISSEVNKDFHVIVIVNKNQIQNMKLDPPFLNRFEKHIINYNMLLEERDKDIACKISEFIKLITSFNGNEKKLSIDLDKLLINCKQNNIEGLIFKIKNDLLNQIDKNNTDHWILKRGQEYEENMIQEILNKIVPVFCQDILAAMILLEKKLPEYKIIKDNILDIYKKLNNINFQSFFKNIKSRKNIIYTFSKVTENLFEEEKGKEIVNKFGKFSPQSIKSEMIESIKSENELIFFLKSFSNSKDKNILVLHFTENDLNKINSINYVINYLEKEFKNLNDKLIIFLIHKQRNIKLKKRIIPDLIPFINDSYNQIFIDNLQGKENSNILKIMQMKNEDLAKEYIENSDFIEQKIYTTLNYMKYNILYETKNIRNKYYTTEICEKIIKSKYIKELILNNLKQQGKEIKGLIESVFTSDIIEINDVDFFEVINSKLGSYFCKYLLKTIYFSFKDCVLNPLLNNNHFDLITSNEYFKKLIDDYFEKTDFIGQMPRMAINANKITIYNGLELPKSKIYFEALIKYVINDIAPRYLANEEILRKPIKEDKVEEKTKKYFESLEIYKESIKREINKQDLIKSVIYNNNNELKKILWEDYFIYLVIKYTEKKEINYELNSKILSFLKLIIKVRVNEDNNYKYDFKYTIEEFIDIILFTQGYKDDIKNILDIFLELEKYCNNFEDLMKKILDEKKFKFEISERNPGYTKIVNLYLFYIFESLIKTILYFSIELKNDEIKFFEFFFSLTSIEASLQKINKKFYLYSKEIYGIRNIIKIGETFKNNYANFFVNYESIVNNIFQQSNLFYSDNYNNLFKKFLELLKILDELFKEKTEEFLNLLFFLYRAQYRNIYNEEFRIKLLEKFFENKLLLKKSKIFLVEILRIMKPEVYNDENENIKKDELLENFMNLENKKYDKIGNLIIIINKINSPEFKELLLFFFEGQCQSYFQAIINKYKNEFNEKCCQKLLLDISLEYLKKAIKYLYEKKNEQDNNLLKLYAIAYIKTYCYYYVEINFNKFDNVRWDEINIVMDDIDEQNKLIKKMRNLYIWRLYCRKFENFDQFENFDFSRKKINIYKELAGILQKERDKAKYIFKNSLISPNTLKSYITLNTNYKKGIKINYNEFNNNFDLLYSFLVNNIVSYLYSKDKNEVVKKMKQIYIESKNILKFNNEGKKLYEYLLNYDLYQKNIEKKISNKNLSQNDFEILVYSLRFIFSTQLNNNKCFYNDILKPGTNNFIMNNYIPGAYPLKTLYAETYNIIEQKLEKDRLGTGYYVCKDCGFFYDVPPCSFPMSKSVCPYMHVIGGENHMCAKKDIRVFSTKADFETLKDKWKRYPNWLNSFNALTLDEYKALYVDKNEKKLNKGIINIDLREFEKNYPIRNINIITFRVLNFTLYSYLLVSYILGNITEKQAIPFLVSGLFPQNFFGVLKKNWELLQTSVNELGIDNVQIFFNMIFDGLILLFNELKDVDTDAKLYDFEKKINEYILNKISSKEKAEKLSKDYYEMNNKLLSFDPYSIKEIILGNYEPSIYDQKIYPDIQYYTVSNLQDYNYFVNKFNSSKENLNKYFLISTLVKKNEDFTQNLIALQNLETINELSNLLLLIYSFKIGREDAKIKTLKTEIPEIIEAYNIINSIQIKEENREKNKEENKFIEKFITPFFKSWEVIKSKAIQYKCRLLRNLEKGEKPLDMNLDLPLAYFLVDDGDKDGGMFLASAYEKMIDWQNNFIDTIIGNNKINGIHNSYISQIEQEVEIQKATKDEIININDKVYKVFNDLISTTVKRNLFSKDNKIIYKNYNDFEYDYDFIEEELGKIILPGIKKFKKDKIKFVTYLFEGFRAGNSSILIDYNSKYPKKNLTDEEERGIEQLSQLNRNDKFKNEIFSSLQILMNEIVKENYEPNYLIYKIIEGLPDYIILKQELKNMFRETYENYPEEKIFTIDTLISIFEFFEALCWKEIKERNILEDYKLKITDEVKKYLTQYFENNKDKPKLINQNNFTNALRKLISRSLAGSRQDIDIKPEANLMQYIKREDLWPKEFMNDENSEKFEEEIFMICKDNLIIGNCLDLYDYLEGDNILNEEINKNKKKIEGKKSQVEENKIEDEKKDFNLDDEENIDDAGEGEDEVDNNENEREYSI